MPELMSRYGIHIRNNMCSCPFHGADRHSSMKVFKDGANCFTCGWNGDIFRFYMDMERCDFKTAFKALGGSYKRNKTLADKVNASAYFGAKKSETERKKRSFDELKAEISLAIKICRYAAEIYEPFSDGWCYAVNRFEWFLYVWELKYINEEEIEEIYVHRQYREIRHYFL